MEQDAQDKMEKTKEDIDEAVNNPVSPCPSRAVRSHALSRADAGWGPHSRCAYNARDGHSRIPLLIWTAM